MMRLCTTNKDETYERIVDIYVEESTDKVINLNNEDTCKLLLIRKGNMTYVDTYGVEHVAIAPAIIFLSEDDRIVVGDSRFKATTVYFRPTVINDSIVVDKLANGEVESLVGSTLHQDYMLIRNFYIRDSKSINYIHINNDLLLNIISVIAKMRDELDNQYDGYWPCRSRSYLIELLFLVNSCYENNSESVDNGKEFVREVVDYLKMHIDEKIDLESITRHFAINRNDLNKSFVDNTGRTCLEYLHKLRMDLAKLLLTQTEIPIAEIGQRVGYEDCNYFTKVFKKEYEVTPSQYREETGI